MTRSRSFFNASPMVRLPRRAKSLQTTRSSIHAPTKLWVPVYPRVPQEIIDRIIELALEGLVPGGARQTDFIKIKNLMLVSRNVRQITLKSFFQNFVVEEKPNWHNLLDFLFLEGRHDPKVGFTRIRHLVLSSKVLVEGNSAGKRTFQPISLHRMKNLQSLWCDFSAETLVYQHDCSVCLLESLSRGFGHSQLTSLTLERITRIDTSLLESIAQGLPTLVDLHLSTTERIDLSCCWTCYEDSLTCISHSPIPGAYPTAEALAESFAIALGPLKRLAHLSLGIFLSDESLVYSHIDQAIGERQGVNAKTEDCVLCAEASTTILRRELIATRLLAETLKNLQSVEWSSFYAGKLASTKKVDEVELIVNDGIVPKESYDRAHIRGKHYRFGGMKANVRVARNEGKVWVGRL
ncbi:hypothetical protein BDN72DRAFT_840691 [Pluteus cervinus]|uniref:Uncharacterized protein n=1 Tax=Pluteus cervinus TaxID=181527 RepID=A0ACD3AUM3_9AGAR|nr:hypothetical protein BDN72DRAFT_840691 [Pluteus cervinus]